MPFQCMHAKPRYQVSHSVARHQLAPAQSEPPALSIIFLTMNVANQLLSSLRIAEMCEECITYTVTELNANQSNLKIDFLLLSRTFLPVGVAYKTTDNHRFS